jgi:hypothetical protein
VVLVRAITVGEDGRVKATGLELERHRDQEQREENERADQIADMHGLGEKIAPGFSQGCRNDFEHPKQHGDVRKLAHHITRRGIRQPRIRRAVGG